MAYTDEAITNPGTDPGPASLQPGAGSSLAPGGGPPTGYPGMDADVERANQMLEQAKLKTQQYGQTMEAKGRALAPLREQEARANAQPIPQPPKTHEPPPVPTEKDALTQSGTQEWLTAVMFLGALGGALSRKPITNSLAAFSGAMKGIEEGNKDRFDRDMKTWEAENKRALEENKRVTDEYLKILKSRDMSIEQKRIAVQIKAAEFDDQAMAQLTQAKQDEAIAHIMDQQIQHRAAAEKSSRALSTEAREREAGEWIKSKDGQNRIKATVAGDIPWPTTGNPRYNPEGYYRNQAVINEALNQGGNANRWNEKRSAATARARLEAGREVPMEMAIRNANSIIPQLLEASNAVSRTGVNKINEVLMAADSQVSNPELRKFRTLNYEFANLWARSMNPTGVTRIDDREKALEILKMSDSPQTYQKNIQTIRGMLDREWQAIQDQKAGRPLEGVYYPTAPEAQSAGQALQTQKQIGTGAAKQLLGPGVAPAGTQIPGPALQGRGLPPGAPGAGGIQQWLQGAPPGTKIEPMP